MRVGVDACCWSNVRGYGRFIRELLRTMVRRAPEDRFVCFVDSVSADGFDLEAPNVTTVRVGQSEAPSVAAAADGYRSPFDMLRLTAAVRRERLDVFFSPSVYTYFPLPPRLPAVVAIHDAIAERYPELTLPSRRARLFWTLKVRFAVWQARLVLTVSEYSRRELAEVLRIRPDRLRVAEEAPAAVYRPSASKDEIARAVAPLGLSADDRWLIYVGGFNPHKHVDLIVKAHARVARDLTGPPLHLLLVGTLDKDVFHGDQARIRAEIERQGSGDLVHWTGFVPDERLRHLHSGAAALLIPSACEGFGLPAVEAAACGAPVIATTESPLPELLEGGGLFLAPGDAVTLARAIRALFEDEARRRAWGETARRRAEALSWDRSADAALAALREAAR